MVDKEKILERLKKHRDYAVSIGYNEDRFLGIFAFEGIGYEFNEQDNYSVNSKIIILPSFSDICLDKEPYSIEIKYENENIEIKDIRLFREMLIKQDIDYVKFLYSEYFILNPKYEELFNCYFINNRDLISYLDKSKAIENIGEKIFEMLKKDLMDIKSLHYSYRLYNFLKNYLRGEKYSKCIQPQTEDFEFLYKLKYNPSYNDIRGRKRFVEELDVKTRKIIEEYKNINSPLKKKATDTLNNGVIEILKKSFEWVFSGEEITSKKNFFETLTNAEINAYYSIVKEIGVEGNIIVSKLVEKNSIPRLTYDKLLTKMKRNNMATVANMGVKGTYIKIINSELKIEALNQIK